MIERFSAVIRRVDKSSELLTPDAARQLQAKMNDVIDAFCVGQRSDEEISKTVVFGKHRVGRTLNDLQRSHLPHRQPDIDFFYDTTNPDIPHLRRGLWISHHEVKIYDATEGENGEQIIYSTPKSPDEVTKLIESFNSMPQFPGDLRTLN